MSVWYAIPPDIVWKHMGGERGEWKLSLDCTGSSTVMKNDFGWFDDTTENKNDEINTMRVEI